MRENFTWLGAFGAWIFVFLALLGFGTMIANFVGFVGNKIDDRSSKKEQCIEETLNIKNEFTAKQMYKKCMKK